MDEQIPPIAVTVDFAAARRYAVITEPDASLRVEDEFGHVAAWLARDGPGHVAARTGTWTVAVERPARRSWALVARDLDRREVARARPGWRARSYGIAVAPDDARYHLNGSVLSGSWSLRGADGRLARLTTDRRTPNAIETFDSPMTRHPLGLLICLALEADRVEATMAVLPNGGGGV
jgi:hypothetical protein